MTTALNLQRHKKCHAAARGGARLSDHPQHCPDAAEDHHLAACHDVQGARRNTAHHLTPTNAVLFLFLSSFVLILFPSYFL
ncbi:hypothetical protein E2C01_064753 [Portunus trituberculatus]|uniref:Uncharacterized protein n=1 Tax=Portunus trituberculatus TaxID=210409 RepID=A0A5B7HGZ0_PORTR|nr:hypothetical protein [Portunus trituberculatus]